jgi:hypothetical protein
LVRLLVWSDGAFEWTSGITPGNPIPERRGSLFLRAVGERRRFRAALEIHRGASSLDTAWEGIFDEAPLDDVDSAATK